MDGRPWVVNLAGFARCFARFATRRALASVILDMASARSGAERAGRRMLKRRSVCSKIYGKKNSN